MEAEETSWDIGKELSSEEKQRAIASLLKFPEVFVYNPQAPRKCTGTEHEIKSVDHRPIKNKVRRIPNKWLEDVNAQVNEMVENAIIEPSCSPYNSNPLLTKKKDG